MASRLCVWGQISKMEYIGGRNSFRSEDETLLSREIVDACAESWPAGVGVVTVDVDSARSFDSSDSTCKEDDARGEETRSGRANFIWLVSAPTARAASLKCARFCVMEEADDRCVAWDRKELTDGSELPEERRVGESVGSVLGLSPNGEGTNFPAKMGCPTRFWTIRGGASIEIEDRAPVSPGPNGSDVATLVRDDPGRQGRRSLPGPGLGRYRRAATAQAVALTSNGGASVIRQLSRSAARSLPESAAT